MARTVVPPAKCKILNLERQLHALHLPRIWSRAPRSPPATTPSRYWLMQIPRVGVPLLNCSSSKPRLQFGAHPRTRNGFKSRKTSRWHNARLDNVNDSEYIEYIYSRLIAGFFRFSLAIAAADVAVALVPLPPTSYYSLWGDKGSALDEQTIIDFGWRCHLTSTKQHQTRATKSAKA